VDHLVLIGEIVVEEYRRRKREHGHAGGDERRPVTDREKQAASDLYYDGDEITGDRQWQAGRSDAGAAILPRPLRTKRVAIMRRPKAAA
jgi:hypothetical protein